MDNYITVRGGKLSLTLIVHPTASLTPDNICQLSTKLSSAWLLWMSLASRDFHFTLQLCAGSTSSEMSFLFSPPLPFCFVIVLNAFPICFSFALVLSPSLSSLLLSQWWYVCQLPPVLEHLPSTSPPSIYLDAIYMLSASHRSLFLPSGCLYTDATNRLSLLLLLLSPNSSVCTHFRPLCR